MLKLPASPFPESQNQFGRDQLNRISLNPGQKQRPLRKSAEKCRGFRRTTGILCAEHLRFAEDLAGNRIISHDMQTVSRTVDTQSLNRDQASISILAPGRLNRET